MARKNRRGSWDLTRGREKPLRFSYDHFFRQMNKGLGDDLFKPAPANAFFQDPNMSKNSLVNPFKVGDNIAVTNDGLLLNFNRRYIHSDDNDGMKSYHLATVSGVRGPWVQYVLTGSRSNKTMMLNTSICDEYDLAAIQ